MHKILEQFDLKSKLKSFFSYKLLYLYTTICFILSFPFHGPDELSQYNLIFGSTSNNLEPTVHFTLNQLLILLQKTFITFFFTIFEILGQINLNYFDNHLITNYLFLPISGESVVLGKNLFQINYYLIRLPQFLVVLYIIHLCKKNNYITTLFCMCIPQTIPLLLNITTDYFSYIISIFFIQLCNKKLIICKIITLFVCTLYLDNNFFPILCVYIISLLLNEFKISISTFKLVAVMFIIILLVRLHILMNLDNAISQIIYKFHYSYDENLLKYVRQIIVLIMSFWYLDGPMSYMGFGPEYIILIIFLYFSYTHGDNYIKNMIASSLLVITFLLSSVIVFSHSRFYLFLLPMLYYGYEYTKTRYLKYEYMYYFPLLGIAYKLIYFSISFYTFYIY
jgi:hypothetical protein